MAELAGLEIEIEHLIDIGAWIWTWPHIWGASTTKEGKFTLVITFLNIKLPGAWPWTWPYVWQNDPTQVFQCIIQKTIEANTNVIFRFQG